MLVLVFVNLLVDCNTHTHTHYMKMYRLGSNIGGVYEQAMSFLGAHNESYRAVQCSGCERKSRGIVSTLLIFVII